MCKNCVKIIAVVGSILLLQGCALGPTLFTIGGYEITLGSVVAMPFKKKIVEELKEREDNEE